MSTEFSTGMLIGAMISLIIAGLLVDLTPATMHSEARDAKIECERSLPRDQYCKITAVPVDKEKK